MARRQRLTRDDVSIVEYDRHTFFTKHFDYEPGDHATFLAPSGGGKTQIGLEALGYVASPDLQATVFVMKPRDSTVQRFAKKNGFRTIRTYPPPSGGAVKAKLGISEKPPGYVLWPPESGDPERDDDVQRDTFQRAMRGLYVSARKDPNIMFLDETYSLEHELGLKTEIVRAQTKGRSVGNGCWSASQRAAWINMWSYQAQHLFLGHDPDKKAQDRYAEIGGGFDPDTVKDLINGLGLYEFLYISRDQRAMCIVLSS